MTIIPVARIAGGAGGGGGEGAGEQETGSGFGTGFGVRAHPVGIYKIHDGDVDWKPTIDITRLARGGQLLAGIITVCITLVAMRRSRKTPIHRRWIEAPRSTHQLFGEVEVRL